LLSAPIFPSLLEEGKAGGGYDVKLDAPGLPLYLQFKRSECMQRKSARELANFGCALQLPYYRFSITDNHYSAQHELLRELDVGANRVFYVAPRFHTQNQFNDAWKEVEIVRRSAFIRPRDIGQLNAGPHTVSFDLVARSIAWVCSDPVEIRAFEGDRLDAMLVRQLDRDPRPLKEGPLKKALDSARAAERRARQRGIQTAAVGRPEEQLPIKSSRPTRSEEEAQLQALADLALRVFGAQLFIVQRAID
jgi:hypothetical protein